MLGWYVSRRRTDLSACSPGAREQSGDVARGQDRRLADVERAKARQGREERRVGERGVASEFVGREGHVGERDVLDVRPGADGAREVERRGRHDLRSCEQ